MTAGEDLPTAAGVDAGPFDVLDLGRRAYAPVLALQEDLVARRRAGRVRDTLLLVEHPPVYTLGRNADEANVLADRAALKARGIDVVRIGRGGDVTYHGPGQLVGYPIIDLAARGRRVLWYMSALERLIVRTLADFGIAGATDPEHRGVWVDTDKVAAVGVRVTGGVTMHGFALNVRVDLAFFGAIVPCGIRGRGVTSMHLLARGAGMRRVKARVIEHFGRVIYGDEDEAAA